MESTVIEGWHYHVQNNSEEIFGRVRDITPPISHNGMKC